jgi:surface antigen
LASSKNLGDYVDRAQYRNSVQAKITATVDKINALKKQLDEQRQEVQRLLADQKSMQARVQEQKAENDRLLAMNQDQQSKLEQDMKSRNAQISDLQRKQAQENARYNIGRVVTGGSGGYPWANVPFPNSMPDPWGMYKRQCVSYTAWKVASTGRYMPYWGGRGNAKQWDDNARAAGIPVDTSPRVGDVAVSNAGTYGHVMYVEAVHDDDTISISQYNASWDGRYSEARRSTTGLVFIHF